VSTAVRDDIFEIGRRVRQGDPLSPNLFNCVLEEIVRKMDWEKKGIGIKIDGKPLNNLRFADDVVPVGNLKEKIRKVMQSFDEAKYGGRFGMQYRKNKTNE